MDNPYSEAEIDPVLRVVTRRWLDKIEFAKSHKKKVFGLAADEALSFYNGPKSWDDLMGGTTSLSQGMSLEDIPDPMFKMSVNKTFEFVTIFGPNLYYENPVRTCKPRMPVVVPPVFFPDQMLYESLMQEEQQRTLVNGLRGVLLEAYLNWTPNEFRLAQESRLAIDEALIKGRGVLWTELYTPPDSDFSAVRTVWDSVDHLLVDPDAPSYDRANWIARKRIEPVWAVEKRFNLRPGSVKGNMESQAKQSDILADEDQQYDRKRGFTNDLMVYWEIYSKMGIGGRLQGMLDSYRKPLEMFGDYCYLAVADTLAFPLNLSPDFVSGPESADPDKVFGRVAWPTPFWVDDEWPCSALDFHAVHNSPWPMPHLKAGIGELKFLNWAMSFLAGKLRNTTRDFIAIKKSANEEIKTAILEGRDLTLLELESDHGAISEMVQFLQHPQVNGDIWMFLEAIEKSFDKRVGLTELMYGAAGQTQPRSASEVNIRNDNMNIRPDDMARQVEAWQADVAAKEAICARYHLVGTDVEPVFGPTYTLAWDQYVATEDLQDACRQLEYRIESGSTRRPNKEYVIRQMTEAVQTLSPLLQTYGQQSGDWTPLNNLLADFSKSRDLDPNRYQLRAMIPLQSPTNEQIAIGSDGSNTENMPPPG